MKVTVEFDDEVQEEVLERVISGAALRLSQLGRNDWDKLARELINEMRMEVVSARVRELVDEALADSSIGLPTMIMERVRFEIQEKLPARLEQSVQAAIRALAVEEARRMESERPRGRRRRWGRR